MTALDIPNGAWIFVGDGRKAVVFQNQGDETLPDFRVVEFHERRSPGTRDQGTDRPGRAYSSAGRRSAVEQTDWHHVDEVRFVSEMADLLYQAAHAGAFDKLVLVAPAKVLGQLRDELHQEVTKRVIAEVGKDLVNLEVGEVEKHLTARG